MANPFTSGDESIAVQTKRQVRSQFTQLIASKIFAKGGAMFQVFDIGNLSFKDNQLLVFKNQVADSMRIFVKSLEEGVRFHIALDGLDISLKNIGQLCYSDAGKLTAFNVKVDDIIKRLKEASL